MASERVCTEPPFELFKMAEIDAAVLDKLTFGSLLDNEKHKYHFMCNLANQGVEKYLKGYIKHNGETIEMTHDIAYLCERAEKINASFSAIKKDCLQVYDFSAGIRYDSRTPISKKDMVGVIKAFKSVYEFPEINKLRNVFLEDENFPKPANGLKILKGPLDIPSEAISRGPAGRELLNENNSKKAAKANEKKNNGRQR